MSGSLAPRVGIVGLGLMGGSLARALKGCPKPPHIIASSESTDDLEAALALGAVDEAAPDHASAAADRDLVVYAAPLGATLALMEAHADVWAAGCAVTDVASLKEPVRKRVEELQALGRWVGSHPMAGGEGTGFQASRADLYRSASVWLVEDQADPGVRERVRALWTAVGAEPRSCDAKEHDRVMTWVSHLPQLAANALAAALGEAGFDRDELGPGGRDMTRLAGSSPDMWRDLLKAGAPDDAEAVRELIRALEEVAEELERGDVDEVTRLMERTRRWSRGNPWS